MAILEHVKQMSFLPTDFSFQLRWSLAYEGCLEQDIVRQRRESRIDAHVRDILDHTSGCHALFSAHETAPSPLQEFALC